MIIKNSFKSVLRHLELIFLCTKTANPIKAKICRFWHPKNPFVKAQMFVQILHFRAE
jgi:hypothetical protein